MWLWWMGNRVESLLSRLKSSFDTELAGCVINESLLWLDCSPANVLFGCTSGDDHRHDKVFSRERLTRQTLSFGCCSCSYRRIGFFYCVFNEYSIQGCWLDRSWPLRWYAWVTLRFALVRCLSLLVSISYQRERCWCYGRVMNWTNQAKVCNEW